MLGWLIVCWAALFALFAAVAGALGHASMSESAVAIARYLIIAAAIFLGAGYAVNSPHRKL